MKLLLSILFAVCVAFATETLHPVLQPASSFAFRGVAELDDDIYSGDLNVSTELAPSSWLGFYSDFSFRLLSYSYEYTREGYLHNYANLHVHGLNETYVGVKILPLQALDFFDADFAHLGLDMNWRFPPYYGSQKERFHRYEIGPFVTFKPVENLALGSAIHYDVFLEDSNYKPGDEFGLKASAVWNAMWNKSLKTGWLFIGVLLFQQRVESSENRNLAEHCRKMKDEYRGLKALVEATSYFGIFDFPFGVGLNYEMHYGSLFGHETGHRIGFAIKMHGF